MTTQNPEDKVAELFGLATDPLETFNDDFRTIDTDWYDRFLEKQIPKKDIADSWVRRYEEAFDLWKEFMESEYPEREPTLANHHHIEAWIDNLSERMKGDSVRSRVNRVAEVYEYMQESSYFPHPEEYNPYDFAKRNNSKALKSSQPREFPQLDLDDIIDIVHSINHVGERAITVFALKTGARPSEVANVRIEDVHIANRDVLAHYDGDGTDHGAMGTHPQLDGRPNAVFIDSKYNRKKNKRKNPTVIPLDDETRRVLIDWLLVRPDNGTPWLFLSQKGGKMTQSNQRHVWVNKHWSEYKIESDDPESDKIRSVSPHYARHWFSSWFRLHALMPEPWVQYMRGDVQSSEVDNTRDAYHRYLHMYYEQIEDEYRDSVFKLGL